MIGRLSRLVPRALSTRLARHAIPVTVGVIGALLLVGIATAALVSPGTLGIAAARISEEQALDDLVTALQFEDADRDGLSDSLENYVYGTSPSNWNSSGLGIPDGWLAEFDFDPLDPVTRVARGRAPDPTTLPAVYAEGYPLAYTPTLAEYYAYGKPAEYRPGVDAPWWRSGEHADPVAADQTRTGIPTGWLLHHGVRIKDVDPDRVAPGSRGNLTIREAWEHDTDPMEADSDGDGIDDWVEIHVTLTRPNKFSTSGAGLADGWALRYGLDPFDATAATQDPDRDGLTNLEEFTVSHEAFRDAVNASGVSALFTRGLNPLEWQTAGTGIPDGWYVRYGLSPFGADVDRVIGKASDFPGYKTYTPEGERELPDITFTVRGAYEYARPDDWNESVKGVWWGGTNPVTLDTDSDGLPDPIEIRGWYTNVTFNTGPDAKPTVHFVTANPLEPDSDSDGLSDLEEYEGRTRCGAQATRVFPPTDPKSLDTAASALSDYEKVCGVNRGDSRYDVGPKEGTPGLDPTKADSAGDHLKDGARVEYWHNKSVEYRANPRYSWNGSAYKTLFEWTEKYSRFNGLSREQVLAQFRPDGDVDNDGIPNVADADPSGGLYNDRFGSSGVARTKVHFLGGPQIDPAAYRLTEFASPVPHAATDPANPDTDGDGLPDAWEIKYGRFDAARGIWDLDPSKQDSDADGVTDDKANNDADVVTWYSFDKRGATTERTTRSFVFTNEMEFLAGTDPNEVATAGDGVPDGWKAFWGSRITSATYPSLVLAGDASIGSVALDKLAAIQAAMAENTFTPTTNLKNAGSKAAGYVRIVNVSACNVDLTTILKPGERIADSNPCFTGNNLDNVAMKVVRIYGVKKITYADEARLRTNPFLADTDGDRAPDAYEAYYSVRASGGSAYPDPTIDDGLRDNDGDGLGVNDECGSTDGVRCGYETFVFEEKTYGAGADPGNPDTDGDGIQDGIESGAGINPIDPSDVESFARADVDRDSDGVPDFQELTGKDSKLFFGEPIRTNANDPDTDGDGLLDGETRNLDPFTQGALVNAWKARGIAHDPQANGTINFLGERTLGQPFGLRPDRLDSRALGVPDGWLAYYNLDKTRQVDVKTYAVNKPTWWVEATHGVWWWGEDPTVPPPADGDADGDGLHDANGEDPFPGINRLNAIVSGNTTITDPRGVESWVKAAVGSEAQRLRAQRVGDGAGDPKTARTLGRTMVDPATNVFVRDLRACVSIVEAAAPALVDKGVAFNVTGKVVMNERHSGVCGTGGGAFLEGSDAARLGVPNRTVIASVFTPTFQRIVGAGFTDAQGRFNLTVNITEDQRYTIPANLTGAVLLKNVQGLATATFDPTQLATGDKTGSETNRLVLWVYNTSTSVPAGHPTHSAHPAKLADRNGVIVDRVVNATRFAVSDPLPIVVRASTRVEILAADSIVNGAKIVGDLRLFDASGAPITDRTVLVDWSGATPSLSFRNLTTDRSGKINLTNLGIAASVGSPGHYSLIARFNSSDPNLIGSNATLRVHVREPARLVAAADRDSATVGEAVSVSGDFATLPVNLTDGSRKNGAPVEGAIVKLVLGTAEASATTDVNGRFSIRLIVPRTLSAGTQNLEVRFMGNDDVAPASETIPLGVKRRSEIVGLNTVEGSRDSESTLRGVLIDNEGQGFEGAIQVLGAEGLLARGRADNRGNFVVSVPLAPLELGSQSIRVTFAGDSGHGPAENLTLARVTSATRLEISGVPSVLVRNSTLAVSARLLDDQNDPVSGQPIAVYWRGVKQEVHVTDAAGRANFLIPTNITERTSVAAVGLEFSPAGNSVFRPALAGALTRVVAGVHLELPDASVPRGPVTFHGRLLDDENRPLPGSAVRLTLDGAYLGEARTSRNGSFEFLHVLADDTALGPHRLRAHFAGTDGLAERDVNATWHVRSPLVLRLTTAGPFIRGESAPLEGRLVDDRGVPVDASLRFSLAGVDLGRQTTSSGSLRASYPVPADLPRGETVLRVEVPLSENYDALSFELPTLVKIRPKVDVELPAIAVRGFAVGGVVTLLDDKGEPLRNTTYAYVLGRDRGAVTGATDAEGEGAVAAVAPISGDATLALTVRGGPDVVAAQFTYTKMRVVGPATPVGYAILIVAVLVVLALAALVVAAVFLRRRQLQEAREILDEAIRDLLAGNEYAGTVFLAYRRFTAYLARHGFVEKASETPREFAVGVRKALPVGAVPLRALISLFEEARYSDHPIGSSERDRAVRSLATVRNELDRLLGQKKVNA